MSPVKYFGLAAVLLLQGCLQTAPTVNVNVLAAPEFAEALKFKVYTVRPFNGPYGAKLGKDLDAAIASNRVAGQALNKTVPFELFLAERADKSRPSSVDAVVSGEITQADWKDQAENRTEQECETYSKEKNFLGLPKCTKMRTVTRYCTKRTATFAMSLRVQDARDQHTVWGKNISWNSENSACQHEPANVLPEGQVMLGNAYASALGQARSSLLATERQLAVKLMELPDALPPAAQERYKGAIAFAKVGRMDRACEQFSELFEQNQQSIALTYSMGLCQESSGRLLQANELYKTADSLSKAPVAMVSEALARVRGHVDDQNKLNQSRGTAAPQQPALEAKAAPIKDAALTSDQKAQSRAEHRIALVIGNAKYQNIGALRNPVNDAQDMEKALQQKGFEVIRVSDGTRAQISQAVRSFENRVRDNSTALVFYSGHGVQSRGVNYLIPVDARVLSEADLSTEAIDMDLTIMRRLEDRNPRLTIIILDACRNNPFPSGGKGIAEQAGLASINAPRGSIVAFSTAPNRTAQDGTGRNGLYTKHLLNALKVPNRKIEDVFKQVRENVLKESKNDQTPWENSALTGDFYFSVTQ